MTELLPCPFCGNEHPFWDHSGPNYWQVCCNGSTCQASILMADTEEQAIARWNRRAAQKPFHSLSRNEDTSAVRPETKDE